MNRRDWIKKIGGAGALFAASPLIGCGNTGRGEKVSFQTANHNNLAVSKVAFIKTRDRAEGVKRAIELLNLKGGFKDKSVFIKPNFNSADQTPGSTHNETLRAIVENLRQANPSSFTIGDRSGMGNTLEVFEKKEIHYLAKDLGANTLVFDDLKEEEWQAFQFKNSLWQKGFAIPKAVLASDAVVNTCCLKTHRYGGHFTLSLKNSVGLAAKRVPNNSYNFMSELHSSPDQRRMIAEINASYTPALILLDGVEAFTDGGPDNGKKVDSQVILAGTDRIAIDAVGVAVLRYFGTTPEVERGKIFEQEQIAQAVKLGIGIDDPRKIDFLTDDAESAKYVSEIRPLLG